MTQEPNLIGVVPGHEREGRRRLFDALEDAFAVRFVASDSARSETLEAAVVFAGGAGDALGDVPVVVSEGGCGGVTTGAKGLVRLASVPELDSRLRGRSLEEESADRLRPVATGGTATVLASTAAGAVWATQCSGLSERHQVSELPAELDPGERLKDRFRAGCFMALLPLVHVLRKVSGYERWDRPPLRAAFVIDDPNLHWSSYGFLHYGDLARHAEAHGYHVGIAVVPRDVSFAHPRTVAVVRDSPSLSLLMHGNDHIRHELARPRSDEQALMVAAQAWRRVASFERRHRLPVARVMVPPHGRCSQQMMHAFLRLGYEAVCYSGALREEQVTPLAGWHMADVDVGGGLPGLPRLGIDRHADERVLRSVLDQPVVLVLHHGDLRGGYDHLGEVAEELSRVGPFRWMSFSELARSSFEQRREGDRLRVRMFSRRVCIDVPSTVDYVVVEAPHASELDSVVVRSLAGPSAGERPLGTTLPALSPGRTELVLHRPGGVDPARVPAPARRPWPLVRRALSEARDRAKPLVPVH